MNMMLNVEKKSRKKIQVESICEQTAGSHLPVFYPAHFHYDKILRATINIFLPTEQDYYDYY